MKQTIILASASPRRKELLAKIYPDFIVEVSRFDEAPVALPAGDTAEYFAYEKAKEVSLRFPDRYVLGADTVVSLDEKILGKPKDTEDAKDALRLLSGREHVVYTGYALLKNGEGVKGRVGTRVLFYPLTETIIDEYVKSGLPLDKAGSYGIQDGYPLVEKIEGSYDNVVGLPTERLNELFKEAGL